MLVLPDVRALIALILVFGFNTDAEEMAGTEKLAVCQLNPNWFAPEDWEIYYTPRVAESKIRASSIALIKGWTRVVAAHFIVASIIKLDLVSELWADTKLWDSLRVVHAVAPDLSDEEEQVWRHREDMPLDSQTML